MGKCVLLRHGESIANLDERAYRDDSTNFLSLKGIGQSLVCGSLLNEYGYKFDHVVTSNLTRAKLTAKIILQVMGDLVMPLHCTADLNEREAMAHPTGHGPEIHLETPEEVDDRVIPCWRDTIRPLAATRSVLVVCHYYVVQSLLYHLYPHIVKKRDALDIENATPYVLGDKSYTILRMPPHGDDSLEDLKHVD